MLLSHQLIVIVEGREIAVEQRLGMTNRELLVIFSNELMDQMI